MNKKFQINLKQILRERNMTASDLSKITGISPNALGKIINNQSSSIHFDTIDKLLSTLDISLSDLITYYPSLPNDLVIDVTNIQISHDGSSSEQQGSDFTISTWNVEYTCTITYKKIYFSFNSTLTINLEFFNNQLRSGKVLFNKEDLQIIQDMFVKSNGILFEVKKQIREQSLTILQKKLDPKNIVQEDFITDNRIK
ncbi:helix-turn-helix domain-containing protein [Enterococcus faecalis]|nr:helix-turn-helix domain-containing protein [Enterococcus faecalis]